MTSDRPRLTPDQAFARGNAAGERWALGGAPFPEPDRRVLTDGRLEAWQRGASLWISAATRSPRGTSR